MSLLQIKTLGALGPQQGEAVRVDGFPGRCRTLNTVSIRSTGYVGPVVIEAALSNSPTDGDWRSVQTVNFDSAPQTIGFSLKGKFTWLRLRVDDAIMGTVDAATIR